MKKHKDVSLLLGPQVTTTERAKSLGDLSLSTFLLVAVRKRWSERGWDYCIPADEVQVLKKMREENTLTTVQRAHDEEFHLLAKLAA